MQPGLQNGELVNTGKILGQTTNLSCRMERWAGPGDRSLQSSSFQSCWKWVMLHKFPAYEPVCQSRQGRPPDSTVTLLLERPNWAPPSPTFPTSHGSAPPYANIPFKAQVLRGNPWLCALPCTPGLLQLSSYQWHPTAGKHT